MSELTYFCDRAFTHEPLGLVVPVSGWPKSRARLAGMTPEQLVGSVSQWYVLAEIDPESHLVFMLIRQDVRIDAVLDRLLREGLIVRAV